MTAFCLPLLNGHKRSQLAWSQIYLWSCLSIAVLVMKNMFGMIAQTDWHRAINDNLKSDHLKV